VVLETEEAFLLPKAAAAAVERLRGAVEEGYGLVEVGRGRLSLEVEREGEEVEIVGLVSVELALLEVVVVA
jgi:hypothetical protein